MFNIEHLRSELKTFQVKEICYFSTDNPNLLVDATDYSDKKLEAIPQHGSQIEMFGALAKVSGRAEKLGLHGTNHAVGEALIKKQFEEARGKVEKGERVYEEFREVGVGAGHLVERGLRFYPRPELV